MRFGILIFLIFTSLPLYSQVEISNKNFNYFDLMEIKNNHFQSQLLISGTLDEIGYNVEWYKIKKKYFSINFSCSYKRLLPNLGKIWVPLTSQWQNYFPLNGIMSSIKFKWYFNHRKFSFAGLKLSGGFLWTNNQDMYRSLSFRNPPSDTRHHIFWANNSRIGLDLTAGRKIVNKLISEISVELGFRADHSRIKYQCIQCDGLTNYPIWYSDQIVKMLHFQILMAFNLFSK